MSATIPTVPNGEYEAPFRARIEKPKDFYGPEHPSNIPDEPVGEVLPEVVFTAGGAIAAPKQARRYASAADVMEVALEKLGTPPGAAHYAVHGLSGDVEKAEDRARAFEVIARAAIAFTDRYGEAWESDEGAALREAVAENRAAVQS